MLVVVFTFACGKFAETPTNSSTPEPTREADSDSSMVVSESKNANTNSAKVKCSEPQSKLDRALCKAIIPPEYREDAFTFDAFEATYVEEDLNNDGKAETIAWESSWAGTSGGMLWLLSKKRNRFNKLFETDTTWTPIYLLKSKHNGWFDFAFLFSGGGVTPDFITVSHNARSYEISGDITYRLESGDLKEPEGRILIGKAWSQSTFGPIPNNQ